MAGPALVIDASVGVKWFSDKGEASLPQALEIRDAHEADRMLVLVPDIFYYEVANAIVNKKHIPTGAVQSAVAALFALGLRTARVEATLLENAVELARRYNITVYDSCYVVVARNHNCPLVTANPRHQGRALGCEVIPIEKWHQQLT